MASVQIDYQYGDTVLKPYVTFNYEQNYSGVYSIMSSFLLRTFADMDGVCLDPSFVEISGVRTGFNGTRFYGAGFWHGTHTMCAITEGRRINHNHLGQQTIDIRVVWTWNGHVYVRNSSNSGGTYVYGGVYLDTTKNYTFPNIPVEVGAMTTVYLDGVYSANHKQKVYWSAVTNATFYEINFRMWRPVDQTWTGWVMAVDHKVYSTEYTWIPAESELNRGVLIEWRVRACNANHISSYAYSNTLAHSTWLERDTSSTEALYAKQWTRRHMGVFCEHGWAGGMTMQWKNNAWVHTV